MKKLEIKEREKQDFIDNLLWKDWQEERDVELKQSTSKTSKRRTSKSPPRGTKRQMK